MTLHYLPTEPLYPAAAIELRDATLAEFEQAKRDIAPCGFPIEVDAIAWTHEAGQ